MKKRIVARTYFFSLLFSLYFISINVWGFNSSVLKTPKGFIFYQIRNGDTLSKIAPRHHWDIIMRVNRIDEFHLPLEKKILLPVNASAYDFLPVPKEIFLDTSSSRVIVLFIQIQYFAVYEKGNLFFWGPISSGDEKNGYSTPRGTFCVLWKSAYYYSKKYEAEMPYAVNFSTAGYFLHQQSLPGRPASHGCVRLLKKDAQEIYSWSKKGDLVIVTDSYLIAY